jgi:V/A-type H+-transporting ATPase subunit C
MKGKMLSEDDYKNMMVKGSVSEVASYLKSNTYYGESLKDLNEKNIHRGNLEMLLYRAEISDSLKIARYLKGNDKLIYRYVYRKQEIEDLKKMLRTLQMGKQLEEIDKLTLFISKYSKINFNETLKAKTVGELVQSVKGTNFYDILKPLLLDETHIDLFSAEMALDMYYYNKLKSQLSKEVKGKDREIVGSIIGAEADLRNILWIYRGKKYYDLNKEILYRYLIPLSFKLNKQELIKMVEANNSQEVIEIVQTTYYENYIGNDPNQWEHEFIKYLLKVQYKNIQSFPYSLAPIVGYIVIKEMEIDNIIAIIEGVRYQVSPDEIRKQLIGHKL